MAMQAACNTEVDQILQGTNLQAATLHNDASDATLFWNHLPGTELKNIS
jgi:hypothetical protein